MGLIFLCVNVCGGCGVGAGEVIGAMGLIVVVLVLVVLLVG